MIRKPMISCKRPSPQIRSSVARENLRYSPTVLAKIQNMASNSQALTEKEKFTQYMLSRNAQIIKAIKKQPCDKQRRRKLLKKLQKSLAYLSMLANRRRDKINFSRRTNMMNFYMSFPYMGRAPPTGSL
eukprot:Platyproteum_vivax@DN6291_c0_g1_i1.p1